MYVSTGSPTCLDGLAPPRDRRRHGGARSISSECSERMRRSAAQVALGSFDRRRELRDLHVQRGKYPADRAPVSAALPPIQPAPQRSDPTFKGPARCSCVMPSSVTESAERSAKSESSPVLGQCHQDRLWPLRDRKRPVRQGAPLGPGRVPFATHGCYPRRKVADSSVIREHKTPAVAGVLIQADEGIRTLDLRHGKATL
jgi:hypothetical protein